VEIGTVHGAASHYAGKLRFSVAANDVLYFKTGNTALRVPRS